MCVTQMLLLFNCVLHLSLDIRRISWTEKKIASQQCQNSQQLKIRGLMLNHRAEGRIFQLKWTISIEFADFFYSSKYARAYISACETCFACVVYGKWIMSINGNSCKLGACDQLIATWNVCVCVYEREHLLLSFESNCIKIHHNIQPSTIFDRRYDQCTEKAIKMAFSS